MRGLLPMAVIVGAALAGCVDPPAGAAQGDATLYVSNQSFDQPVADISVWVDETLVFQARQPVEDQHRWDRTAFAASNGTHVLRAQEAASGAQATRTFGLPQTPYLLVQYWTGPPRVTVDVSTDEFAFD